MVTDSYLPQPQPSDDATWGQIASYLIQVESSGSWRPHHHSFTQFLEYLALTLHKGKALLWRLLAAGRVYQDLQSSLGDEPSLPPLNAPKLLASPDSLELFDKIARVAPDAIIDEIQIKVLQGKISRNELRALWNTYRPVLDGQTKRGRYVAAPRFNAANPGMVDRQLSGNCRLELLQAGPTWLDAPKNAFYRVLLTSADPTLSAGPAGLPELLVLCARQNENSVEIHGIAVTGQHSGFTNYNLDGVCATRTGMDYFWLMCPGPGYNCPSLELLPKNIGLLELTAKDGLLVQRPAGLLEVDAAAQVALLRSLIVHVAHPA